MPYPVNGILWEVHKWPYLRMRSENMAKIALNALRLRKFEPVNGKSWSPAFGSLVGQLSEIGGALSCQRMLAFLFVLVM